MKFIGLVPLKHQDQLREFVGLDDVGGELLKHLDTADLAEVKELSVNFATPEYDVNNTAADIAGAISISIGEHNAEPSIRDLLNAGGAEVVFETEERHYWDLTKNKVGDEFGFVEMEGINQMTFLKRLPMITHQEFSRLWDKHSVIAKEHHPGVARYIQNVVQGYDLPKDLGTTEPTIDWDIDGIAELSFLTIEDMKTGMRKDETSQEMVYADIGRFLDIGAGNRIFATRYLLPSL